MQGTFLRHLDDLADQTATISKGFDMLIDTLSHRTGSIWDVEWKFGRPGPNIGSLAFVTAAQTITSNLIAASRSLDTVWEILTTNPWLRDPSTGELIRPSVEPASGENRPFFFRDISIPQPTPVMPQRSLIHMTGMRQKRHISTLSRNLQKAKLEISWIRWRDEQAMAQTEEATSAEDVFEEQPVTSKRIIGTVLAEICENSQLIDNRKNLRHWTHPTMDLMFVLYASSPQAYSLAKRMMALPAVSSLFETFGPEMKDMQSWLQHTANIPLIVDKWRRKAQLSPERQIDVIMGVDAASFAPTKLPDQDHYVRYCYLFHVMPTDPQLPSFTAHLLPHQSPSLGTNGYKRYDEVSQILGREEVRVLAYSSDGDRGNISRQRDLFETYKNILHYSIEDICARTVQSIQGPWWIADTLHALKCQRARLENDLWLGPGLGPVNAEGLNATLDLSVALTNFQSLTKMNDVLAVEVFAIDNLEKVMRKGQLIEACYLLPFVCWYSAMAIQGLEWETRLYLLKIAFYVFADWYKRYTQLQGDFFKTAKFFVEIADLARYLNTILFLYHVTAKRNPIAYNRIGTHPVENIFGLVRVRSHFDHTWPKFLMSIARAIIMDYILTKNNMKSHVRREFGIAGVKVLHAGEPMRFISFAHGTPQYFIECLMKLICHGSAEKKVLQFMTDWMEGAQRLANWKNDGHGMKLYHSGSVASQSIISRHIAFGKKKKKFVWTPQRMKLARRLHIRNSDRAIARRLGCPEEDLPRLWLQSTGILDLS
jgi:hypothetical protein